MRSRFLSRSLGYGLVAAIALVLGSTTVARAVPPIDIFRLADGADETRLARVDSAGSLSVSVANQPATQNVSGTVNVGNLPATQSVSGTVNVGNFPATQQVAGFVDTRSADALQAYQASAVIVVPDGAYSGGPSIVVPAGKRLVIEFITGLCYSLPSDQQIQFTAVGVTSSGFSTAHYFPVAENSLHQFITSSPTKLYANPGTTVRFECARTGNTGTMAVVFTASGYLVTIP